MLAVLDGLCPGESVGLQLGDISDDGVCLIQRRIYRRKSDVPKSKRGNRAVPLAERTMAVLGEYKALLQEHSPTSWLFPSENGKTPIDYPNVFRRRIRPALERAGLRWVNFQAMRRTSASELGEVERDPKVRAELLGHSVDVHENEYRQTSIDTKRRAKKALEDRLQ
jgi:integrase